MQSIWLIIIVFFLLLFICPTFFKINASYNVLENKGAISVKLFFIKLLAYKVTIKNNNLVLYTTKKTKDIKLDFSSGQKRFIEQFIVQIKEKILLEKICLINRIGLNDAFNTAMMTGFVDSVFCMIGSYIKNNKKDVNIQYYNIPNFNGSNVTFSLQCGFFLNMLDVLYSIIISFLITKRSEKYEKF